MIFKYGAKLRKIFYICKYLWNYFFIYGGKFLYWDILVYNMYANAYPFLFMGYKKSIIINLMML